MGDEASESKKIKLVGAVVQSFRIMRVLAASNEAMGVSSIARDAQVNPSTAFNILRTLVHEGVVEFDSLSKSYKLGAGILKLTSRLLEQSIVTDIRVELSRLASDYGCLIGLWQVADDRMILIDRVVADRPIRLDMMIKQRMPLMLGAVGRALAAHRKLSDKQILSYFDGLRWEGKLTARTYIKEIRDTEKTGYGVDREALYPGVVSIGVILTNHDNAPIYGITASLIASSADDEIIAQIGARLVTLGQTFSVVSK